VRDASAVEGAGREGSVARLAVARDRLHEEAEQGAGGAVGERAVPAHAVAVAEEARAKHVVGATASDGLEHAREVSGVVLTVPVEVDRGGVALVAGDFEAGAKGGAQAA
jgi:hypothetical protein